MDPEAGGRGGTIEKKEKEKKEEKIPHIFESIGPLRGCCPKRSIQQSDGSLSLISHFFLAGLLSSQWLIKERIKLTYTSQICKICDGMLFLLSWSDC